MTNSLYHLSRRDLSLTLLETRGDIPSPRREHASALVGNMMIVWGGRDETDELLDNGLYLLNIGPCSPLGILGMIADHRVYRESKVAQAAASRCQTSDALGSYDGRLGQYACCIWWAGKAQ